MKAKTRTSSHSAYSESIARTALIAIIALIAFTGCSPADDSLMATIPADSPEVAKINLEEIAANSGCEITDGGLRLTAEAEAFAVNFIPEATLQVLCKAIGAIDAKHIFAFRSDDLYLFTFTLTDADAFRAAIAGMAPGSTPLQAGDMTVYGTGDAVVVRGSQAWVTEVGGKKAAELVEETLRAARKAPLAKQATLVQQAEEAQALWYAVSFTDGTLTSSLSVRGTASVRLGAGRCSALVKLIDDEGREIEIPALEAIDTDFLRFVPGDFNVAAAVGVADGAAVAGKLGEIAESASLQQQMVIREVVMPLVAKVRGTVSVAACLSSRTGSDAAALLQSPFIIMARMEQAAVDSTLTQLLTLARSAGATVAPARGCAKEGLWEVTAGDVKVYAGSVDGKLAVATVPPAESRDNALAKYFLGRLAACYYREPVEGDEVPLIVTAEVMEEGIQLEVACGDVQVPFLEYMLSTHRL